MRLLIPALALMACILACEQFQQAYDVDGRPIYEDGPGSPRRSPGAQVARGIDRSIETGSPWPALLGAVGAAGSVAFGLLKGAQAKSARDETAKTRAERDTRRNQAVAVIRAVSKSHAAPDVAELVKREAKKLGVEDGPGGLKELVNELGLNVSAT